MLDTVIALLAPFAGCAAMAVLCAWMMRRGHTPPAHTTERDTRTASNREDP